MATAADTLHPLPLDDATQARRGLAVYFTGILILSGSVEWALLRTGDGIEKHIGLVALLMWTPAIASLLSRLVLREGIRDVSFRVGGRGATRMYLTAWLWPTGVGLIAYGAAWLIGLVHFYPEAVSPALGTASAAARFLTSLALALTVGALFGCLTAAGEEIGWRGYMLTRLVRAGAPYPLVLSGIIWALWHFPLILSGQYASSAHPALSAALFMTDVAGIAIVIGIVRLRSGSVWPAVLLHASWNAVIQGPFDRASSGAGAALWVGESGVLVALVSVVTATIVARVVSTDTRARVGMSRRSLRRPKDGSFPAF